MIHLGEPSKGRVVEPIHKMRLCASRTQCLGLPHDEDDLLWTRAMYFKVEGVTFQWFALVANAGDWTHATTGACMRVEDGPVLWRCFLLAEVGHRRLQYPCQRSCENLDWNNAQ